MLQLRSGTRFERADRAFSPPVAVAGGPHRRLCSEPERNGAVVPTVIRLRAPVVQGNLERASGSAPSVPAAGVSA
jgi:hypothetical protein